MNKIKKKKNLIKILNKKLFLFSILALFLGSYWSQQELNWGGWWNWDFVELIALIFFILITTISHVNNNIFNFLLTFKKKIIKYLILFFFLIRVDILNSVHSFNSFNSFIHNLNIYYLTFVILTVIFINKNYSKYYKNKNINTLIFLFLISLYSINLYIYWNIVLSFIYNNQYMDLTKNIKQFLVVNLSLFLIFNFKKLKTLNLLIISLMFLIFFSIIFNSDIDNITIKYNLYLLTLIIIIKDITNYKYNEKNIIHIFFIIFIICNIFNYNYQSYYCLINLNLNLNLLNNSNLLNSYNNYLISYYNNNNCLFINNYYCYNNNILFTSVFKETLVNNILLLLNKIKINYNIEKLFLIFNINNIFFYCFIFIFFTIKYKNKTIKKKDNIV